MTSAYTDLDPTFVPSDVYVPREDSQLLIDVMEKTGLARGSRVADLCTGTGILAIAACEQGASQVTAFDICPRAVHCARTDVAAAGFDVSVHLGSWARAVEFGPYDLVICNPPSCPMTPASTPRNCRPASDPHGRGMPDTTGVLSLTRCARRRRSSLLVAARCCLCNPSSPDRGRRSRRWPAPGWMLKLLPTNGSRSDPC